MKKIAILGGGLGGMTAAFGLTRRPGWQAEYEITVYQMGWRLGGKGASGRNRAAGQRIEEHGLHIWMGFYENAFRMMRDCYLELGRPAGAPLATVDAAFRPQTLSVLCEFVGSRWVEWPIDMPVNSGVPGEGGPLPTPWEYVQMLLQFLVECVIGPLHEEALEKILQDLLAEEAPARSSPSPAVVEAVRADARSAACPPDDPHRCGIMAWLVEHLHLARAAASALPADAVRHTAEDHAGLIAALDAFVERLASRVAQDLESHDVIRRLFILADLGVALVRGILRDGILTKGFVAVDDVEFRAWLGQHGASRMALSSAPVREIYDLCFAYEDGELAQPNLAAGTAAEIALRIGFTYKGSVMYRMQAGMGDTVFAPIYALLKRAGVKFAFFHKASALRLSDDGKSVETIHLDRQADLADGVAEYDPLCDVKGLPCWPSEPDYAQLRQGSELRERGINLESRWSGWAPVGSRVLRKGQDFDLVILGISLGALPETCGELIAASPAWRDMIGRVGTVQTQAVQLWLKPSLEELGGIRAGVVAGTYAEPLDTWADMSELLPREDWPADGPKTVLYFCGPKPGATIPPSSDTSYPAAAYREVRQTAQTWLESAAGAILPRAVAVGNPAGLDWTLLHGVAGRTGGAALETQYLKANIDPTERYVLSLAGSTRFRLRADDSGFTNLYLAGDWVRTGLNAGCVEAAVMAGLAASQAISGFPREIVGWNPADEEGETTR